MISNVNLYVKSTGKRIFINVTTCMTLMCCMNSKGKMYVISCSKVNVVRILGCLKKYQFLNIYHFERDLQVHIFLTNYIAYL